MSSLRPYQQACLDAIHRSNFTKGLCILPTGSGKSHIISKLNGLCVAPRREIVNQNLSKGAYCMTINRAYLSKLEGDLLIIDEAHMVNRWEGMYCDVMRRFNRVIGFTATPYRLNSGHLVPDTFDEIIYEIDKAGLVESGYLVTRHFVKIPSNLIINVKTDEFSTVSKISKASCPYTHAALAYFTKNWDGKKTLIYGCDLEHAGKIKDYFEDSSVPVVSSLSSTRQRNYILENFKNNQDHKILINCELLTTGFDCPQVSNIIILRPTQSYSLYEQICGRGDRPCEGKALNKIYDFTISAFNFDVLNSKPNHVRHCIFCYEQTDYRLKNCTTCGKIIIRGEAPSYKCWSCKSACYPAASYCGACGKFIRKNILKIDVNSANLKIKKNTSNNYKIIFTNGFYLTKQSKKAALYFYKLKKLKKDCEFFFKYDMFKKQHKFIKMLDKVF